jgi:DNA mismatch repair protein MSH6
MDGPTYINLEIFGNSEDGGKSGKCLFYLSTLNLLSYFHCKFQYEKVCSACVSGTLYKYLDNCVTSSGKRLLRNWICCPLKDAEGINNRLDVVDHLIASPEIVSHIAQHLRKLPDLELLLGRTKSSLKVSSPILLPLLVKKILKQRVGSIAVKEIHMAIYINTEIFTG